MTMQGEGDEQTVDAKVRFKNEEVGTLKGDGDTINAKIKDLRAKVLQVTRGLIKEHDLKPYFFVEQNYGKNAGDVMAVSSESGRALHNFGAQFGGV
jgi:hypothetical protein